MVQKNKEVAVVKTDPSEIEYQTRYGSSLTLTFSMVKEYLINGDKDLVTKQELVYFMELCKARGLNPFLKDAYLVKYSKNEPAQIITSVDYLRKHAKNAPDCKGWQAGVIVAIGDSELEYREGAFVGEGEKLLGGWAEARPEGWESPKKHSVNLRTYIKKTRDGKITQFWREDKQPDMIMKVAECQLLRQLWGEESTGMYAPEEMPSLESVSDEPPIKMPVPKPNGESKTNETEALSGNNKEELSAIKACLGDLSTEFDRADEGDTYHTILTKYVKTIGELDDVTIGNKIVDELQAVVFKEADGSVEADLVEALKYQIKGYKGKFKDEGSYKEIYLKHTSKQIDDIDSVDLAQAIIDDMEAAIKKIKETI